MLSHINAKEIYNQTFCLNQKEKTKNNPLINASVNHNKVVSIQGAKALRSVILANISFKSVRTDLPVGLFREVGAFIGHPHWEQMISREIPLYVKPGEMRSPFERDRHRILYSQEWRRLGGKTQVFLSTKDDHICRRSEHVTLVAEVAESLARALGLNTDLVRAIGLGHDIGHPPFGHQGERMLKEIVKDHSIGDGQFWHERHGLRVVDRLATIENIDGIQQNLNLTYAVRDGITCHCGEVDLNGIHPRSEFLDLNSFNQKAQHRASTWEGLVVLMADKMSFLGRDIEDALAVKSPPDIKHTYSVARKTAEEILGRKIRALNNTFLVHHFISDLVEHSSPEHGIGFSEKTLELMTFLRKHNTQHIYIPVNTPSDDHVKAVITSIFNTLKDCYNGGNPKRKLREIKANCPTLVSTFEDWLNKYSNIIPKRNSKYGNRIIYDINNPNDYHQAIFDYIAGMTDRFANRAHNEITGIN